MDIWVRDYAEDLRRFLLKRCVIESDIKDVCQEVYLRMLRFERAETLQNPLAYLFRVAANVAHDFRLRQTRWADASESAPEEQETAPSAEELVEADSHKRALLRALSALPPLVRAVIALRYQEQLTYDEIAERLGVSRRVVQRTAVWDTVQSALNGIMFVLLGEQLPGIFESAVEVVRESNRENPWWLAV